MTRRHVQALQRAARAVRGHVEYRTRSGRLALPDGSAAFARLYVAEVPRELRGRVTGWRLGVWRERSPGEWSIECWPDVAHA